jgi:hypothetical protein
VHQLPLKNNIFSVGDGLFMRWRHCCPLGSLLLSNVVGLATRGEIGCNGDCGTAGGGIARLSLSSGIVWGMGSGNGSGSAAVMGMIAGAPSVVVGSWMQE